MPELSRVTVERILGRYEDTTITVSNHDDHHSHSQGGHTVSTTTVNSRSTYSAVFEAEARTYKFTDSDHVILERGDRIRMVWVMREDGLRQVEAMVNETRGISRLRKTGAGLHIVAAGVSTLIVAFVAFVMSPGLHDPEAAHPMMIPVLAGLALLSIYLLIARDFSREVGYSRLVNGLLAT